MHRPSSGYRGSIRAGHHYAHTHHIKDIESTTNDDENNNDDNSTLSTSDEKGDDNHKIIHTSAYSSLGISSDFETAIRNLRPSGKVSKKNKTNLNTSSQKADLPQLDLTNDEKHANKLNKAMQQDENDPSDEQSGRWFPKPDVGHVNSDAFIRHNHVDSEQPSETSEQLTSPTLLTKLPPVGISTRPTAVLASVELKRSASALFTSNSSIKKATNNSSLFKIVDPPQIKSSSSSAFQPINSTQNIVQQQLANKSTPLLMDIPQHKPLERGQQFTRVHISHPKNPSTVYLMLNEDFITACRLLRDMLSHPELQLNNSSIPSFKAQINRLCACYHEGRWFRCRISHISPDFSTATVLYLDWGMTIPTSINPQYIRRLPNEFYTEPACSIICHLDGVPETNETTSSDVIAQCIALLSENEYDVTVSGYNSTTGGKIILSLNGQIINDQIRQLLMPNVIMSSEEELIEQFRHEPQLNIGTEVKAILSSFSGKDDSFYLLLVNENTIVIDQAMNSLQEMHQSNCLDNEIPRTKTLVVARYVDDGKLYRAWIKSICLHRQQATVFFVDFGNESLVKFSDVYQCPDSVRNIPWLGIHVRLIDETMTYDELIAFWKLAESNYLWIKILEIFKDCYGIQIKIDYMVILRQERMKSSILHRSIDKCVQVTPDERSSSTACPSSNSDMNSCLMTPLLSDLSQVGNETLMRNLFEMINNELRRLRHRINDSDEASQDRHNQLMQLLFSTCNINNSNNQKKLSIPKTNNY